APRSRHCDTSDSTPRQHARTQPTAPLQAEPGPAPSGGAAPGAGAVPAPLHPGGEGGGGGGEGGRVASGAPRPGGRRAGARTGACVRRATGGGRPVIIESILTTMDPAGKMNFAPMGVEWGDAEIVIKPFLETTTFRNLRETGAAVVNLTDDVMLFARGATSDVQFPAAPASVVRGVVLEAACS